MSSRRHPEEKRQCTECAHEWFADRYKHEPSVNPFANNAMFGNGGAGVTAKQVVKYEAWRRYSHCPSCSTERVVTIPRNDENSKPAKKGRQKLEKSTLAIVKCPKCDQKLRVPSNIESPTALVRCPRCTQSFKPLG